MSTLPIFIFVATIIVGIAARPTENRKFTNDLQLKASSNNAIVGIASIAGITSRNGRVSSVGGVKFFPGTDVNEYFYPLEFSSERDNNYPLTFSTEKDGKYASGTVQVNPGYVSASATARFGSPRTESRIGFSPSNLNAAQKPFQEFFFQPQPDLFASRNLGWFAKDFFQSFRPSAPAVRNGWLINDFNPFMNFWR